MPGNGFEPVGLIGGRPYNGATNRYWIASGATGDIVVGQPVGWSASTGTIVGIAVTPVAASQIVGIFAGCSYIDSQGVRQWSQKWTSGTVSAGAFAMVHDDPDLIMRARILNGSSVDVDTATIALIGSNAIADVNDLELGTSGRSGFGVVAAGNTTNTFAFRIVGLTNVNQYAASATGTTGTSVGSDTMLDYVSTTASVFTHALVAWNTGIHHTTQATGV